MEGSYIPSGLGRPSDPPGGAGGRGLSLKFYFYQCTSQPSPPVMSRLRSLHIKQSVEVVQTPDQDSWTPRYGGLEVYISHLAWEYLGMLQEELEFVAREKNVWATCHLDHQIPDE